MEKSDMLQEKCRKFKIFVPRKEEKRYSARKENGRIKSMCSTYVLITLVLTQLQHLETKLAQFIQLKCVTHYYTAKMTPYLKPSDILFSSD